MHRISPDHRAFADRLTTELGPDRLREGVDTLKLLSATLDILAVQGT